ncbi:MAG: TolC family protein [Hallerella sp.]|nr:TolC family protein [Fibrobacter sp.]MDY6369423.1 TolC family protein [Fibrobacter sp.]MDY6390305.1 TolC family protein [Fibrobacter sp.]MEE3339091.1 TolC family protein [Hallerella sp.]
MSRFLSKFTLLVVFATIPTWATSYTREDAVRIALEKSSTIKTAEEELISANSQVDAGYGNAMPSIDLDATVTRIFGLDDVKKTNDLSKAASGMNAADDEPYAANVLAPAMDNLIYGMKSQGYRWQSSVGLTATQVLYAQGKVGTGIEIAKIYKHLKEVSLENAKANVRYDVENAFDQLVFLDSSIVILETSIDQTQKHIDYVNQAVQSGLASELDQVRAQLELDKLKSTLEKTKKSRVLARNNLLNTMGLEWDSNVEFQGDLRYPTDNLPYPDTAMENVKKRRKELALLDAQQKMAEKNISIEEGGYKPTIVLVGGIKYANNKNKISEWDAPDWDDNINKYVALNLTMNLFNGMKTKESVVQAKSSMRSVQIQKESAERGFRMQIESCANTLEDANNQLEIQKNQVNLAQRNFDLTEASYKVGRSSQLDFLDASLKLRSAKNDYLQAIVDWNKAYNALLQATGEY